jgi:hypothetical protein
MPFRTFAVPSLAAATVWLAAAGMPSLAQDAISAPATKSIGVAKPEMVPSLIVLNADGASISGDTLTLTGVAPNAIIFADRPVRAAGHALTAYLLEEWDRGAANADGAAAVFIDIIGLPRTPVSFAGTARRTAYRGA